MVDDMLQRDFLKLPLFGAMAAGLIALSACTGTSTYGTGKTQEAQLLEDIGGIAMIGSKKDKPQIDYMSRPGLVKPTDSQLPPPAEGVPGADGNFPQNPEQRRLALLKEIEEAEKNGEALPQEVIAMRKAAITRPGDPGYINPAEDKVSGRLDAKEEKAAREAFLKRQAEIKGATGAAPRRYLTEPPQEYRTPKQTAEIGNVGEKEHDPFAKKKDTNLLDRILGND